MKMYYLGILLSSHLAAGILALVIDYLFYREEIVEVIKETNQELNLNIDRKTHNTVYVLGGWFTLLATLKSIFDYYFEPDDENDE